MHTKETARRRAEVIVKVRSGQLSATAGAELLGVSRKTYYEWEARGLGAMLQQLEDQEPGRPPDPFSLERSLLAARIKDLEQRLAVAEQTAEIRAVLRAMEEADAKKKGRHDRPRRPDDRGAPAAHPA